MTGDCTSIGARGEDLSPRMRDLRSLARRDPRPAGTAKGAVARALRRNVPARVCYGQPVTAGVPEPTSWMSAPGPFLTKVYGPTVDEMQYIVAVAAAAPKVMFLIPAS